MSLPRTYRGWSIDTHNIAPASMAYQASHPDYEDPAYDDGRPLVLTGCDAREVEIAIDDFLFELGIDWSAPLKISNTATGESWPVAMVKDCGNEVAVWFNGVRRWFNQDGTAKHGFPLKLDGAA